ncbi:MAG: UDP-N-acetylmuramoyl-L-alanyl-D-glutamate--2,6-diaminopimelate ligase [Alphaproteobacteria bacterium]|nr:UDP-N-acetylmuramoyl-L-alanyl-D-glutamate--2,6-diaminopimelate ligase [Alphaproteobacteria bacterium]
MLLTNLAKASDCTIKQEAAPEITGITADSRSVKPGFLFIAIPGTRNDGREFLQDAIKNGASAVLIPENSPDMSIPASVAVLTSPEVRVSMSSIAAGFYQRQPSVIAAVTGTSGKTSTVQFAMEIWHQMGKRSASIGTLGLITPEINRYGSLTTPDAITLHQMLDEISGQNISHLAMEASSHGLVLHRLDNVNVKIGAFTNLSRDHLDYHKTPEEYFAAKLLLFTKILSPGSAAVLNADIPRYDELVRQCKLRNHKIISYGKQAADIKLLHHEPHNNGQLVRFCLMGKDYEVLLPVMGSFQVWNSLCALGIAIASGCDEAKAAHSLEKLIGVPGRLQLIGKTSSGGTVFVDYAHKPDALENVLNGLRPHVKAQPGAKLGVVFGCGGNRDNGKRPIMGEIAQRLADWVIVTDDNPRNEDPAAVRKEILAGCAEAANLREIGDRKQAIKTGIEMLKAGDVLVIAGKGHEVGQIVKDKVLPFDDTAVAREAMGIKL